MSQKTITLTIPAGYRPLLIPERLRLWDLVDTAGRLDCEHVLDSVSGQHTWLDRQAVRNLRATLAAAAAHRAALNGHATQEEHA